MYLLKFSSLLFSLIIFLAPLVDSTQSGLEANEVEFNEMTLESMSDENENNDKFHFDAKAFTDEPSYSTKASTGTFRQFVSKDGPPSEILGVADADDSEKHNLVKKFANSYGFYPTQFLSFSKVFHKECQVDELRAAGVNRLAKMFIIRQPSPVADRRGEIHIDLSFGYLVKHLGMQVVSLDGFPLGYFPKLSTTPEIPPFCSIDARLGTMSRRPLVTTFRAPKVDVTNEEPESTVLSLRPPAQEFHIIWVYRISESDQINKGFQFQFYIVPEAAPTCFMLEPFPIYRITHRITNDFPLDKPTNASEYNCHGHIVELLDINNLPIDYNPGYIKKLVARGDIRELIVERGDFCPKDKQFNGEHKGPVTTSTKHGLGEFLNIDMYTITGSPIYIRGWYHFFLKTNGQFRFKRIIIRVVTRNGGIVGNFLRPEGVPCTDLPWMGNSGYPLYIFHRPPGQHKLQPATVLEVSFNDYVTQLSIFWTYNAIESDEVQHGIQIQAYILDIAKSGATTSFAETKHFFSRQFSSIYSLAQFNKDVELDETGESQGCLKQVIPPIGGNTETFILDTEYKKVCEQVGLKTATEAVPIWNMRPNIPQIRAIVGTPKTHDYVDEDYVDYSDVRNKVNGSSTVAMTLPVSAKDFYDGCGEIKACLGWYQKECVANRNCVIAVSFRKRNNRCLMELMGQTKKYLAVGLSRDKLMGEDSIVECVREEQSSIRIYMSYNAKHPSRINNRIKIQNDSLALLKGWFKEDFLYCAFQRKKLVTVRGNTFDLTKEDFYLLLAHGDTALQGIWGGIGNHARGSYATDVKYWLMNSIAKNKNQRIAEQIHAIALIFVWIFCFPISTFMVRYFKETYFDKYFLNLSIWFAAHVILMGLTFIVTASTVIHVGLAKTDFTDFNSEMARKNGWHWHNIASFILVGAMLVQMSLGIFISTVKKERRIYLVHLYHGLIGHSMFFLSYTIIYKSKDMQSGLPCQSGDVLIVWLVLYFVIHLLMSYQVCYTDFVHGLTVSRVYTLPNLSIAETDATDKEAPGGSGRKLLLGIFILCALSITVTLIAMVATNMPDCNEVGHRHEYVHQDEDEDYNYE